MKGGKIIDKSPSMKDGKAIEKIPSNKGIHEKNGVKGHKWDMKMKCAIIAAKRGHI